MISTCVTGNEFVAVYLLDTVNREVKGMEIVYRVQDSDQIKKNVAFTQDDIPIKYRK